MVVLNVLDCECGEGPCILKTSHTKKNPDQKFWSCPLSKKGDNGCDYFRWANDVSVAYVHPFALVVDEAHQCSLCSREAAMVEIVSMAKDEIIFLRGLHNILIVFICILIAFVCWEHMKR